MDDKKKKRQEKCCVGCVTVKQKNNAKIEQTNANATIICSDVEKKDR